MVVSSELLEIECCRVFHRYRLDGDIDDTGLIQAFNRLNSLLLGISIITISTAVKKRARGPFPVTVKTLDALHLSSAVILSEEKKDETILMFSHDAGMNRCARALGFSAPFSVD
jgi:hypothetical protein